MKFKIFSILIMLTNTIYAQCNGRYQSQIFNTVTKTTVYYSDQAQYQDNFHNMDIYIPDGDTATNRPLIIFIHGGSYIGGDKSGVDCIDFCEHFAKQGYVTASVNYRLNTDPINFILSQEEQYLTVLNSVADIKAAIRYFRKDVVNGNSYGIDESTIFIGGSSAGAVTAVHVAYVDDISDLPTTSTPNGTSIQSLVNSSGGLNGDVGNDGYSSNISAVISFAGGINNVGWIESQDEPLVSIQGDADQTISFNCAPGLGYPTVLTLCGSNEMHTQANSVNIINDMLVFNGADHDWFQSGNADARFMQALNFTSSFLYPLLPCNQVTTSYNISSSEKQLIYTTDLLGKKINQNGRNILLHIYSDGTVEKKITLE